MSETEPDQPTGSRRTLLKGLTAAALLPNPVPNFVPNLVPNNVPNTVMAGGATLVARSIPVSGELIPAIGLGTWQTFDVTAAEELLAAKETLRHFAKLGGTVVDSSPMYGESEAVLGQLAAQSGLAGKLFLATKVWTTGREAGMRQMEDSFRRMGTRRMDLMQIHNLVDVATHTRTLRAWKEEGRVRYWGITHYHVGAYAEVERLMKAARPDFLQINYSLAEPESAKRLLPLARDLGIAVIANRPFAEGVLFARVKGKALPSWATEFDAASWAQFFLKWILADAAVTCVIPATRNPKHLADNMAAGRGRLPDQAQRARMSALLRA